MDAYTPPRVEDLNFSIELKKKKIRMLYDFFTKFPYRVDNDDQCRTPPQCLCVFNDLMARRRILFSLVQKTVPEGNRAVTDRVAYSVYLQV